MPSSMKTVGWRLPWIVMIVSLYVFCLPWIAQAIVLRYWIEQDYNAVLVGLDKTPARKFFMVAHMTLGAICLLLGPTQFLPVIRRKWPAVHRWTGRVYILSAVLCSVFGTIFIFLKKFLLVGGYSMGVAFLISGLTFGATAVMTAIYALRKDWIRHRNWAILAFSQILSPMLYRYFYLLVGSFEVYGYKGDLDCDSNDVCLPFTRPFDAIHAWTYFMVPLAFAQAIVWFLPNDEEASNNNNKDEENPTERSDTTDSPFNYARFNMLGLFGAAFAVVSTLLIYVTAFGGTNDIST